MMYLFNGNSFLLHNEQKVDQKMDKTKQNVGEKNQQQINQLWLRVFPSMSKAAILGSNPGHGAEIFA